MMSTHAGRARTAALRSPSNVSERAGNCSCGCQHAACSATRTRSTSAPGPDFGFGRIRVSPEHTPIAHTLAATNEGTETASPEPTRTADAGAAAPGCSSGISGGSFTSIEDGQTLPASLTGNKLARSFDMVAEFVPTQSGCSSNCGEYRQYVRGSFTRNGAAVVHPLCGSNLDPATYQEDCANVGGTTYKYGYHSNRFATSYFDNPDQASGLTFHGTDAPGITGRPGATLSMQLDFRGQLVDACNGNAVLRTAEWSVAGTAVVP